MLRRFCRVRAIELFTHKANRSKVMLHSFSPQSWITNTSEHGRASQVRTVFGSVFSGQPLRTCPNCLKMRETLLFAVSRKQLVLSSQQAGSSRVVFQVHQ